MKKLIKFITGLAFGIFVIPALFAFAIGIGGTLLGFIAEPRIMIGFVIVLAIISIPGMLLMFIIKR